MQLVEIFRHFRIYDVSKDETHPFDFYYERPTVAHAIEDYYGYAMDLDQARADIVQWCNDNWLVGLMDEFTHYLKGPEYMGAPPTEWENK